jgi:hypothetical protein
MQLEFCRQAFEKILNFVKVRPVGAELLYRNILDISDIVCVQL